MKRTEKEIEIRNRILVSVYAYAYEYEFRSLITDDQFDELCKKINPSLETGRENLDDFFMFDFDPSTGMWISNHPELEGIKKIYKNYFEDKPDIS